MCKSGPSCSILKGKLMSTLRHAALHGLFPQLPLVVCQFVSDGPDGSLPGFAPARHGSHEVVRAQGVQMGPMSKEQGFQLPKACSSILFYPVLSFPIRKRIRHMDGASLEQGSGNLYLAKSPPKRCSFDSFHFFHSFLPFC